MRTEVVGERSEPKTAVPKFGGSKVDFCRIFRKERSEKREKWGQIWFPDFCSV